MESTETSGAGLMMMPASLGRTLSKLSSEVRVEIVRWPMLYTTRSAFIEIDSIWGWMRAAPEPPVPAVARAVESSDSWPAALPEIMK